MSKVYQYTKDTWWDGDYMFECYNAVGWCQNGSATSFHELFSNVLWLDINREYEYDETMPFNPYVDFSEQELLKVLERRGIILEQIEGSILDYLQDNNRPVNTRGD